MQCLSNNQTGPKAISATHCIARGENTHGEFILINNLRAVLKLHSLDTLKVRVK